MTAPQPAPRWACRECDYPVTKIGSVWYHRTNSDNAYDPHPPVVYDARTIPYAIGSYRFPGLSKLNEEAGEVIQIIGKLMATGGRAEHWQGDIREALIDELGDLEAAIHYVVATNFDKAEQEAVNAQRDAKVKLFDEWHRDGDPPPATMP